ncbi:Carnitine O-acetyltransferase [Oopsacas minuta]|uniref:Carnitine O-acetyltransferase n=1 Tax=Oopsacas minuta TaxID=111878 RepID=A0AAV7JQ20_9METZ|nr:Carnitine O-acetyltransferase [Oopsacas minuta]
MLNSSFPKLPVPDLKQTLNKYLQSIRPLISSDQYNNTVRITNKFLITEGPYLQSQLLKRAANTDNWLLQWWKEVAYLAFRMPVPVYISPVAISEKVEFESKFQMLDHVSLLIVAYVNFFESIRKDELSPDKMGDTPLCMRQYKCIPGGHRIPGKVVDSQRYSPNSEHIIVMCKGHFFKFPVFGYRNGHRYVLGSHEIKHLLTVITDSYLPKSEPIGVLTSLDRDSWYEARVELKKSLINTNTLEVIESCLFLIGLDDEASGSMESALKNSMIGIISNDFRSFNRWFDVGVQTVVSSDGYTEFILEHSLVDGPPVIMLANRGYYSGITGKVPDLSVDPKGLPKIEHLEWEISHLLHDHIRKAKSDLKQLSEKIDLKLLKFTEFGKNFFKSYKISPDSLIQLAIQLTFYKLHRHPTACYESVSTRKFYDGRTDTLRSTSTESTELVKAMLSTTSIDVKLRLLSEHIQKHDQNSRQASSGQGIDRHLLGLKLIANQEKLNPEFFSDLPFSLSTNYRISTSQIPNPFVSYMGFGPVVEDGYGVCYNPHGAYINFSFTSYTTCSYTVSAVKLCQVTIQSLRDVKKLVESRPVPAKL